MAEPFCLAWPPSRRTISSIQRVAGMTAGAVGDGLLHWKPSGSSYLSIWLPCN
ncbi:hypothetical protein INR49_002764 [Caranx melampygus]|nr:hypothetical protein INR49_002764 [Caranx melampygus]